MVVCESFSKLTVNASMSVCCLLCVSINCLILSNFKLGPKQASNKQFWQWNYMDEVSRLLVASPRQGLMETFLFLINCLA